MQRGGRLFRVGLWSLLALLALLAAAVVLLTTAPVRRWALTQLTAQLGEAGVAMKASALEIDPLALTATVRDVVLHAKERPDRPFLRAPSMRVVLVGALSWRRPAIDSITIAKPEILIRIGADGRTNLPALTSSQPAPGNNPIRIGVIRIENGSIEVDHVPSGWSGRLPNWSATLRSTGADTGYDIAAHSAAPPGSLSRQGERLELTKVEANLTYRPLLMSIRQLAVFTPAGLVRLAGEVAGLPANPQLRVDAELSGIDAAMLSRLAGQRDKASGNVSAKLAIDGPIAGPRVLGDVQVESLRAFGQGPFDGSGRIAVSSAADRAQVSRLNLRWNRAAIEGTANIALKPSAGVSVANLRFRGLNVRDTAKLAGVKLPVGALAGGSISASLPYGGDPAKAFGEISLRLDAQPSPGLIGVAGNVVVKANQGVIHAVVTDLQALGGAAQGEFTMQPGGQLSGSLDAKIADANRIPIGNSVVSGPVDVRVEIAGTVEKPEANLSARSERFVLAASPPAVMNAEANLTREAFTLRSFRLAAPPTLGATLTGTMRWDQTPAPLSFDGTIQHRSLLDLLRAAAPELPRSLPAGTLQAGSVAADFRVDGTVGQPLLTATIRAEGLQSFDQPMGNLTAAMTYGKGSLVAREIRLRRSEGSVDGRLSWDPGDGRLDADMKISDYRVDSLRLPNGAALAGILNGTVRTRRAGGQSETLADLTASAASMNDFAAGAVALTGRLTNDRLTVAIGIPAWKAAADLDASLFDAMPAQVKLKLDRSPLQAALPGRGVQGSITADLDATLNLDNPTGSARGQATVAAATMRLDTDRAREYRIDTPSRLIYDGRHVTMSPLTVASGDSRLTLEGRVPAQEADRTGRVTAKGDLDVEALVRLAGLAPDFTATGRVRADTAWQGGGRDWRPSGTVTLSGVAIDGKALPAPLSQLDASLELQPGAVLLRSAGAKWLRGDLRATGSAPLSLILGRLPLADARGSFPSRDGYGAVYTNVQNALNPNAPATTPFVVQADFAGLDLGAWSGAGAAQFSGAVSGHIDLSGRGLDLAQWEGRLETSGLKASVSQVEFSQQTPLVVNLSHSLLRLDPFKLTAPGTALETTGSMSLRAPYPLALRSDGTVNVSILQLFVPDLRADGNGTIHVAVTGTLDKPRFGGAVELAGVQLEVPAAQVAVEDLRGRFELEGDTIRLDGVGGLLNGGKLALTGQAKLTPRGLEAIDLHAVSEGSAWNVPEGLQTAANADLRLTGDQKRLTASGTVDVLEGGYRESLVIERGLLRSLSAVAQVDPREKPITVALNIRINTAQPIAVVNDLLNGELTANLRVTGTSAKPGVVGRLDIVEGATLFLGGRSYVIDRGVVTFADERKIEPTLDFTGRTRAGEYQITLQARGTVGQKLETAFTSDPPLPEPDIMALLVTGRTLSGTRGAEGEIAQDQAISYLGGNLASAISQQAGRALGFNLVRIEPGLIAEEAEPTARLTLGQSFTSRVGLVYSVNLKNSADQIWIGRFDLTKRFTTRVVRQTDNSYRFQFQHGLEFGGVKPPQAARRSKAAMRIGEIDFAGDTPLPLNSLRGALGLKKGKVYDFLAFRKGMDRLSKKISAAGFPEARLKADRRERNGAMAISIDVSSGPKVGFSFEGYAVPRSVRDKVRRAWSQSGVDSLRIRQAGDILKERLVRDRFYGAAIDTAIQTPEAGRKQVVFDINRGLRYGRLHFAIPDAPKKGDAAIAAILPDEASRRRAVARPDRLKPLLEDYYRRLGFLDVVVRQPRLETSAADPRVMQVLIPVQTGKRATVGTVTFTGNRRLGADKLAAVAELSPGKLFESESIEQAQARVEGALAAEGLHKSEVALQTHRSPAAGVIDLEFQINEGERRIVEQVVIEGNDHVGDKTVRAQLGVKTGDVLTAAKLSEARRRLYSTGAFTLADIEAQPVKSPDGSEGATRLVTRLREVRPFELRYGALFDTEKGPGGIVDFATRNILGSARVAGVRGRYDSQLQELRGYLEQPSLLRFPLKWVNTGFRRRELDPGFITDRIGASTYMEYRRGSLYRFNFGYRVEQVHTFEREPDPVFPFDIRLRIAPLTFGVYRDSRDDLLDASRGSFTSHVSEFAPSTLGSELRYAKYFGQYLYYRPLTKPALVPWAGTLRSRIVYAGGVRFGLASGLGGQTLIPSERFLAGGGTSVRGFAQNRLGPLAGSTPLGGESIFVVNQELRLPLYRFVDVVGFVDAGNVFPKWRDFDLTGLRSSAGAGLRLRTPYLLLRLDYGFVLDRRTGERAGRLFFGIGQSF